MHELSVALSLVDAAEDAARRAHADRVVTVRLELGALSGVHAEALRFGYDVAVRGTLLEGSELLIEEIPIVVSCDRCGETQASGAWPLQCPKCGIPCDRIVRGQELRIRDLEIEP